MQKYVGGTLQQLNYKSWHKRGVYLYFCPMFVLCDSINDKKEDEIVLGVGTDDIKV